jgi:adenine deaminase
MKKYQEELKNNIAVANGFEKADLVLKNARILNVFSEEICLQDLAINHDTIVGIGSYEGVKEVDLGGKYLVPGFIDAHMHIESSMVTPFELARAIVPSGTTTIIADPHELVNVAGKTGLDYLLDATKAIPLNVFLMLPSSVPATPFETNGAGPFGAADMQPYLDHPQILGLGEVMCFPDVLAGNSEILDKLTLCRHLISDGHAPGLTGKLLQAYACAGIHSEHESTTFAEALEKLRAGFYILVREGSAAKNLHAIISGLLKTELPIDRFLFCTDDKHLEDIHRDGHIRFNIKRAIDLGLCPIKAIKMATINTAQAYGLKKLGAIAPGYRADLVILSDLGTMNVEQVYWNGRLVDDCLWEHRPQYEIDPRLLDSVHIPTLTPEKLQLPIGEKDHVIEIVKDQIETRHLIESLPGKDGFFTPNATYNKLCVIERHGHTGNVGVAPIKGFGIKNGAIATTVAHDSHNIIVVGDNDQDILLAVNHLTEIGGGYVVATGHSIIGAVPLILAGLISLETGEVVQEKVASLISHAHKLGVPSGVDPFITLSFMALPVIPALRLTDLGLFDVDAYQLIFE